MPVWLSAMWTVHWGCLVGIVGLGTAVLLMANQQRIHAKERRRDRRIREEFEAYARLDARLSGNDDIRDLAKRVCRLVAKKSSFQRVAMLVEDTKGRIHVPGSIGMDEVTIDALQTWGERMIDAGSGEPAEKPDLMIAGVRVGEKSFAVVLGKESAAMGCGRAIMIPLQTTDGRIAGVLAVCADRLMTVQRRTVEEAIPPLELLAMKLERALEDAAQTELLKAEKPSGAESPVSGVAQLHALSNPLTAVLGFAELIAETTNETRVRSDAEKIIEEAHRMRQTLQALLNFGRPGTPLDEPVNIGSMVREMMSECEEKLEHRGVRLSVQVEDELPLVHGNGDRLRQVVEHLLNNSAQAIAASASEDAEREDEIRISVCRDRSSVQVIVSDTGPGFKDPARVFDSLHVAPQPGESKGRGLSICYEIVGEHGGEISAFNLHPHGAAVMVELPAGEVLGQHFSGLAREVA